MQIYYDKEITILKSRISQHLYLRNSVFFIAPLKRPFIELEFSSNRDGLADNVFASTNLASLRTKFLGSQGCRRNPLPCFFSW
ncbi:hypothetical protein CMV16_09160 [Peribacillus simplex]|nr:hypothetical protein CMV16_09160 [Peribacillus simplex]